jgi:integrase
LANRRLNRVIVRLACCCGLRASEIAGLRLADLQLDVARPHLRIRAEIAKGGRARKVPLWWDRGTLGDIVAWKTERLAGGAAPNDFFVTSVRCGRGRPLSRHTLRKRVRTACKVLGLERLKQLTIHHGRHTFISHALAGSRTLAEVRDAAGHSSVLTTSVYLHIAVDDDAAVGELFGLGRT